MSRLVKHFSVGGLGSRARLRAVDGVDLDLWPGEILALVGESGSGKSTLARCILGLEDPTDGTIELGDERLSGLGRRARARLRAGTQPVFQDPYSSLDPRWTVAETIGEGLDAGGVGRDGRDARVRALLERVGLDPSVAERRPHELSGGQRQRVCIAAAVAASPRVLVADEPVTALDVSVQAQVMNLLKRIQEGSGLAVLLIAHDLSVVAHISTRIAVMYLGRIVETGPTDRVFSDPRHPYTQALIAATPRPDPAHRPRTEALAGEIPSPTNPPPGCHFHPRCPHAIKECRFVDPELRLLEPERLVACHVAPKINESALTGTEGLGA